MAYSYVYCDTCHQRVAVSRADNRVLPGASARRVAIHRDGDGAVCAGRVGHVAATT